MAICKNSKFNLRYRAYIWCMWKKILHIHTIAFYVLSFVVWTATEPENWFSDASLTNSSPLRLNMRSLKNTRTLSFHVWPVCVTPHTCFGVDSPILHRWAKSKDLSNIFTGNKRFSAIQELVELLLNRIYESCAVYYVSNLNTPLRSWWLWTGLMCPDWILLLK